jgi:hypothetical protein
VVPDDDFTGAIDFKCDLSMNGQPRSRTEMLVGLLPTNDAHVFKGRYAATPVPPDITRLPTVPLVSGGLGGAGTRSGGGAGPDYIAFDYIGQITLGGRAFHGTAGGAANVSPATSVAIPPFLLANADSSSDTLSATCSGQWLSTDVGMGIGAALAVLTCNGSVNGGPPGTTTLVSVYAITSTSVRPFVTSVGYTGVFAGI